MPVKTPLVIRNNMAAVGWAFCFLWVGGLVVFTGLYARDGGFNQFDPLAEAGVLILFWVGGLALAANLLTRPLVRLIVRHGGGELVRTWPWARRVEVLSAESLRAMTIGIDRDSDGDPYYRLRSSAPSGGEMVLCESGDRKHVESIRDRILDNL